MLNDNDPSTKIDNGQENEPSKPINKPEDVPASNDEKIDEDFPGYPHYPAKEDILNPANNEGREKVDVENLTRAHKIPKENIHNSRLSDTGDELVTDETDEDDDLSVNKNEADLTADDLMILGAKDGTLNMGLEDDQFIKQDAGVTNTENMPDIPGADLDDESEDIGEEDEENNYYSIGGDNHDNLEENSRTNN
ncbi:MAG: hypothetical protein LH478_02380 [Chitinophagaceae bacterium]|nr:hypothetical protein [Chitinophagaceae bacterium]